MISITDMDKNLQRMMQIFIGLNRLKNKIGEPQNTWSPGKKLKLLFAGYLGTRNTGADVRVEEMIRQIRYILGNDAVDITALTFNKSLTQNYFTNSLQLDFPKIFPYFLYQQCPRYHGIIACEGSMFKSKFATALSILMAGTLGMANTENKLSLGYGAEAGEMTTSLRNFVTRYCHQSLIICRNKQSQNILNQLSIRSTSGTDTAWTFSPLLQKYGLSKLRLAGWDGQQKILAVCPINPFWWPVKPYVVRAIAHKLTGCHKDTHYDSIYFHKYNESAKQKYRSYIRAIANAIKIFCKRRQIFPILIGMEKLDRQACSAIANELEEKIPSFISDEYNMYELVSILRCSNFLLSSRYHGIVTSMPAQVVSAGITMDERIHNLMEDRDHLDYLLWADEDHLEEKILTILEKLYKNEPLLQSQIAQNVATHLQRMGQMGIDFTDELQRCYPDFPLRTLPKTWDAHLPPLSPLLSTILEQYA